MSSPDENKRSFGSALQRSRLFRIVFPVVSVFAFWYAASYFSGLPAFVIPTPGQVLRVLIYDNQAIRDHLGATLAASGLGYLLSNVVGIGLAVLVTSVPLLDSMLTPVAIMIRNVPYVALATVLALALGDTMTSKVLIITIAGFFPVMVNTVRGIQSVDAVVLDRMRVLDASPWRIFWQVRMPYSLPFVMAAQEITGSIAIAIAIAAEWMLSSSGLGYVINQAMAQYRGDKVYAVALLAAAMSYGVYVAIQFVGRKLNWRDRRDPSE